MLKNKQTIKGFDGPYETPIILPEKKVIKDWIDFNGHMNVAFFTLAFDQSLDIFLEDFLGIGETHALKINKDHLSFKLIIIILMK